MNRKFALALKQQKKFTQYIKLTHKKISALHNPNLWRLINEPAIFLLEDFLKRQGTSLDEMIKESMRSRRTDQISVASMVTSKEKLLEKTWPCWQYINFALNWVTTKRGSEFWRNVHNKWVEYVAYAIIQPIISPECTLNYFIKTTQL